MKDYEGIIGDCLVKRVDKRDEIREMLLHEICGICIHKPTHYRKNYLTEDKTIQIYGLDCSYDYAKDSGNYCSLARKTAAGIMERLDSMGVVIEDKENAVFHHGYFPVTERLIKETDDITK